VSGLTAAVVFALLPAAGNFAGGLLAEVVRVRETTLSYALHAATGVVLAVVGLELMPEALAADAAWVPILAFVAGALFFIAADHAIGTITARFGGDEDAGPWMIYFGVAIDLFSDGLMIGTGATIATSLGLLLAIGQIPADIPEGFAVIANFRARGIERRKRLLIAAALAVPVLAGAVLGYLVVRDAGELVKVSLLAFTGGVLTTVVVEEIVPEAHREGGARFAAIATVGGFALFAAISRYVG
jgi:ZIP family zinc transporter